ncbi:hypothetical protein [Gemmiger sp. An194]|uniref:hypothetical protein n=1 Tax=Gemmiger sp. An194 TaxID=1965582 RepID=UPI000B38B8CD|nr:hypothetical protein [Gemmiger sp. An194]OUP22968.1 hypothetical protein B5F28_13750 [Gemmiger sp. An194]
MDQKSDLDRLREWLGTYPGYDLAANMLVDYLDSIPGSKSLRPGGLVEISRNEDILGNVTVSNQYNFGLYIAVAKSPGDGASAAYNADWVLDFQRWVQQQSITHRAPTFGNIDQQQERIKAQNGELYDTDQDGVGLYIVALSAEFKEKYEVI